MNLSDSELSALNSTYKANPEAYKYYIQGKRAAELRSKEGLENSVILLNKAIKLDPNFADAYSVLAFTIFLQERNGFVERTNKIDEVDSLAALALKLDENNIEGLLQSSLKPALKGRNSESTSIKKEALQKAPNNAMVHHAMAQTYIQIGDYENCLEHRIRARDLNPLFWLFQSNLIETLMSIGKYEQAAIELENARNLFPEQANRFLRFESRLKTYQGEYQEALEIYNRTDNKGNWDYGRIGYCYAQLGQNQKAIETLDSISNSNLGDEYTTRAIIYSGLNDPDSVIHYLSEAEKIFRKEKELNGYGIDLVLHKRNLRFSPYFKKYHNLSEYQELLARMSDIEPVD